MLALARGTTARMEGSIQLSMLNSSRTPHGVTRLCGGSWNISFALNTNLTKYNLL